MDTSSRRTPLLCRRWIRLVALGVQTVMEVNLTEKELAYLSRAVFRQRIDKPDDEPELAATLDGNISVWRMRARQEDESDDSQNST